ANDPAHRFSHTREQAFQITAAGDGTRERDHRFVDLRRRCPQSLDDHFVSSPALTGNTIAKDLTNAFMNLRASADVLRQLPTSSAERTGNSGAGATTRPAAHRNPAPTRRSVWPEYPPGSVHRKRPKAWFEGASSEWASRTVCSCHSNPPR